MTHDINQSIEIPIAILIFKNAAQFTYRAYSPSQFTMSHLQQSQLELFLSNLYIHIEYDAQNPINNHTKYGALQEVHTRFIQIPFSQQQLRQDSICYFTTYTHPHCHYRPIHTNTPVFFNLLDSQEHRHILPHLYHSQCTHQFI